MWRFVIDKYIVKPFRRIRAHPSFLIPISIVILLDRYDNSLMKNDYLPSGMAEVFSEDWFYHTLPLVMAKLDFLPPSAILFLIIFSFQVFITVFIMTDLREVYMGSRRSLIGTLHALSLADVIWFFFWQNTVYTVFVAIAVIAYLISYFLWRFSSINTSLIVVGVGIFVFPVFYAFLSIGSKIAVLPLGWCSKLQKATRLLHAKTITACYVFYLARLGVEAISLVIIPVVSVLIFQNSVLRIVVITLALIVPFSVFRASTFEFFLSMYADDEIVQELFFTHYKTSA